MRAVPVIMLMVTLLIGPGLSAQTIPTAPVPIATEPPLPPASAIRSIELGQGRRLSYRVTWSETVLRDADGTPAATISATSYVRDGATAERPVLVAFNGGPGASSSPLHFSAFGPRRLSERDAAGNRALLDNRETLLDTADLVFVDPVGTGFSRPLREGGGKGYWSVDGDAAAAQRIIRDWLVANGRTSSPLYIAGESYGGYRLGTMAKAMADLNVAGLILVSPALDFASADDQSAIDRLPTMAVAAWHHRKPAGDARSAAAVWDEARRFAESDYAAALQQGALLDAVTRDRIAARLAQLTTLPQATVSTADLRIDSQRFLEALVPGSIVGRLDVRVVQPVAPPAAPGRPAAANDPALGLGRSNVIVSTAIGDYLRREVGVTTMRDYYSLTLDVNFAWDWNRKIERPGESWSVVPAIGTLMRARPAVRVLAVGGLYDLATPWLATRHALSHGGLPMDRVATVALPAGHSPFESDADRARGTAIIRDFMTRKKLLVSD